MAGLPVPCVPWYPAMPQWINIESIHKRNQSDTLVRYVWECLMWVFHGFPRFFKWYVLRIYANLRANMQQIAANREFDSWGFGACGPRGFYGGSLPCPQWFAAPGTCFIILAWKHGVDLFNELRWRILASAFVVRLWVNNPSLGNVGILSVLPMQGWGTSGRRVSQTILLSQLWVLQESGAHCQQVSRSCTNVPTANPKVTQSSTVPHWPSKQERADDWLKSQVSEDSKSLVSLQWVVRLWVQLWHGHHPRRRNCARLQLWKPSLLQGNLWTLCNRRRPTAKLQLWKPDLPQGKLWMPLKRRRSGASRRSKVVRSCASCAWVTRAPAKSLMERKWEPTRVKGVLWTIWHSIARFSQSPCGTLGAVSSNRSFAMSAVEVQLPASRRSDGFPADELEIEHGPECISKVRWTWRQDRACFHASAKSQSSCPVSFFVHVLSRAWFVLGFPSNEQQTKKNTNKATGYNGTFFQQGVWNACFCVIIFDVGFPKRGMLPTPIHHIRHDTSSWGNYMFL